ncbi:MAG: hypothetical protein E7350_00030 [Clostridiales bacterium]|nr:hypothetical protein [Clostridiales bacterium]
MKRRVNAFVWSSIFAAVMLVIGVVVSVSTGKYSNLAIFGGLALCGFALIICLILKNNFVGEMMENIFEWGFVTMPGLIFTLDLDGIIWLLTVKLLFWILGIILASLCGMLAIGVGLIVSIFVAPYAIMKEFKGGVKPENVQ